MMRGHYKTILIISIVAIAVMIPAAGFSSTIVQHNGSTDPSTEGWVWSMGSLGVDTGAVTNDGGYDAWYTDDTIYSAADSWGGWSYNLVGSELDVFNDGWKASARLRAIDSDLSMGASILLQVNSGARRWHLSFGQSSDGKAIVNAGTYYGNMLTTTLSDDGYHLYEIICDMSTSKASVFIDGSLWITDWTGYEYTDPIACIAWGSGQSGDTGRGNWNLVSLETVPEPAGVMALVSGLLSLGAAHLRRRA